MKPTFDSATLACVVDNLQFLTETQVQRLHVSDSGQIILSVYQPSTGERHWLFDISASWARTHLTRSAPPKTRQPLAFESALRKYVLDGTIRRIAQHGFDRILTVDIAGKNGNVQLIGEFMGHRSNLILCKYDDNDQQIILHATKLIPARQNRHREILPGRCYIAPPHQGKADLRDFMQNDTATKSTFATLNPPASKVLFGDWLKSTFEGISPLLEREILYAAGDNLWQGVHGIAAQIGHWQPVIYRDEKDDAALAYPFPLRHSKSTFASADSIHQALEIVYSAAIPKAMLAQRKSTFSGILRKAIAHNEHALRQVQQGLGESSRAAKHRHYGELLYAQLHAVTAGAERVAAHDFYNDTEIIIPLDKTLSPAENAARYFERAKHSEARQDDLKKRQEQLENQQFAYLELQENIENAASLEELQSLQTQLPQILTHSSHKKETAAAQFDGHRIKILTSPDGYEILVGENATSNDYLVRHVMKSNDWWLHVRGATSAHAVIRSGGAPQKVPKSTLEYAAREVAKRSAAKHAGYVAVDYTLGKYVRKPRKSAPGAVTYEREKTLHLMEK